MILYDIKGDHAYADIKGRLAFNSPWSEICRDAVAQSKLNVVREMEHEFSNGTQLYQAVLSESSFVGMLYPDGRQARIDCYTCGDEGQPGPAITRMIRAFNDARANRGQIVRGELPDTGIAMPHKERAATSILAISDVVYKKPIVDQDAFALLQDCVSGFAAPEDTVVLRHDFEPQGMTAVMSFLTRHGQPGHVDVHTYPEHNYVSFSAAGAGCLPFNILAGTRPDKEDILRGNVSTYRRESLWALPKLTV